MNYFAYGANTLEYLFRQRYPSARLLGRAVLRGHELRWNSHLDLLLSPGQSVAGILWDISPEDMLELDRQEGIGRPGGYTRSMLSVYQQEANEWRPDAAWVYYKTNDAQWPAPSLNYFDRVREGYTNFDLPLRQLTGAVLDTMGVGIQVRPFNTAVDIKWTRQYHMMAMAHSQTVNHPKWQAAEIRDLTVQAFSQRYQQIQDGVYRYMCPIMADLPADARILNVGSGIGTFELGLARVRNWDFYLLDSHTTSHPLDYAREYHGQAHGFYNSWEPLADAVSTMNLDMSRFHCLRPDSAWPTDVDFIMSSFSWCWHYELATYFDKVLGALKPGGILCLDILNQTDSNAVQVISQALNCQPRLVTQHMAYDRDDLTGNTGIVDSEGAYGARYYWVNQAG